MRAIIINKHHENFNQIFQVIEILQERIVCLEIEGRKIDFGLSEIKFIK